MKQRLITSGIGLLILFVVCVFFDTAVLNTAIALISLLAVYELLSATGCFKSRAVAIPALLFTAIIPFLPMQWAMRYIVPICYIYVAALFIALLRFHEKLHIEQIAMSFLFCLVIPFSLTTVVYIRDRHGMWLGIFYVLMALGGAWLSDTGAYFAGRAFGKHKLAPYISPKKTVEGAVGGVIFAEAAMLLLAWLYSLAADALGHPIIVNYAAILIVTPVLSVFSIVGDLSASVIKRQYKVKDYGSIMPGHGGIMDRFDSVLMVAPLIFMASRWFPLAHL